MEMGDIVEVPQGLKPLKQAGAAGETEVPPFRCRFLKSSAAHHRGVLRLSARDVLAWL